MANLSLNEEELRAVLERAHQIQQGGKAAPEPDDVETLLAAAEETGLHREAVEQALWERLGVRRTTCAPGELVLALSADRFYYIAEVIENDGAFAKVRFEGGGESRIALSGLQPFDFSPGRKVQANWPGWGWRTCSVVSCKADQRQVQLFDGWTLKRWFSFSDLRVKRETPAEDQRTRAKAALWIAASALGGGVLGSLATWLLTR